MCAGIATDTVVSDTSMSGELAPPIQLTEQVADAPCEAGGVHIERCDTLTEPVKAVTVSAALPIVPIAPKSEVGVMDVTVDDVDTNRNLCAYITLLRI
jgi:pentose-5-phosphate-3-epimerase